LKTLRIINIMLLIFLGITATVGGYFLMADPGGEKMQLSESLIKNTPFKDYFIPGMILLIMNGLLGLISATATIFKWKFYQNLILLQGCILVLWIIAQWIIIQQVLWLQFVYLAIGIFLVIPFFYHDLRITDGNDT